MSTARGRGQLPVADLGEDEFIVIPDKEAKSQKGVKTVANLQLLWEHRSPIGRIVMCGFIVTALMAFLIPSRYESTARLMPPDNNQAASGLAAVAAMVSSSSSSGAGGLASEFLGLKSTSEIFVGILSSRTVEDELIQNFNLRKVYWDRRIEDARKDLEKHTNIEVERKSQIVSITVTDHSPQRAAEITQAYVEQLNRLVALLSTSAARRERVFLEDRLKTVGQELESAEKQFSQFASKNTAIDIKEQGKAMMEAAATLQGQLIAAQSELQGLRQIFSDNNVRVRSVRARIGELQRQLEKISGKGEDVSDGSSQPDQLYPSIRRLPLLGVTYADLYRQTKVQEVVFETLTKQYELAKVQEAKEIPTVKVLDSPTLPEKKSFPPRILIILLGTTLSFCGATVWVFGRRAWDATNSLDPRKVMAESVITAVKARLPRFSQNGTATDGEKRSLWKRIVSGRHKDEADT